VKTFELVEPTTIEEAVELLDAQDPSIRAIAGGTALMLMMKARLFQPTRLVSLRLVQKGLRGITSDPARGLRIGALTPLTELERSPEIEQAVPVVTRTLRTLSNVRIRNVATLGGHLAHGDPHMDLPPVLMTLGTRVHATSRRGDRWIDIGSLFEGYYQTTLERDELITHVFIPRQPEGVRAAYAKFTALSADDWPAVGVAVWYRMNGDAIGEARVAVSAATERPLRVSSAEVSLVGSSPGPAAFAMARRSGWGAVSAAAAAALDFRNSRRVIAIVVLRLSGPGTRGRRARA